MERIMRYLSGLLAVALIGGLSSAIAAALRVRTAFVLIPACIVLYAAFYLYCHLSEKNEAKQKADALEKNYLAAREQIKNEQNVEAQKDTKVCPYCAEDVKLAAILCKHCGRDI
jgi:hypothetical protein